MFVYANYGLYERVQFNGQWACMELDGRETFTQYYNAATETPQSTKGCARLMETTESGMVKG